MRALLRVETRCLRGARGANSRLTSPSLNNWLANICRQSSENGLGVRTSGLSNDRQQYR